MWVGDASLSPLQQRADGWSRQTPYRRPRRQPGGITFESQCVPGPTADATRCGVPGLGRAERECRGRHDRRWASQRLERALPADTAILILELGANDGLRGTPLGTIEANLSSIIERARSRGVAILLCGMETPPLNGWNYTVNYHQLFPRLAARYDLPLVPFLLAGVAFDPALNGDDGIHSNGTGAQRIADIGQSGAAGRRPVSDSSPRLNPRSTAPGRSGSEHRFMRSCAPILGCGDSRGPSEATWDSSQTRVAAPFPELC